MKKMKMRETSSNLLHSCQYIPSEVLTQILAQLPAKTLLRFRCVCKSWCSIIDNPDFVSMHLHIFNNNKNKNNNFNSSELLAIESSGEWEESGFLLTLRKADTLRKISRIFESSERYLLHGSCNSLLLISRSRISMYVGMRICNPSIRKSLLIPPCPLISSQMYKIDFVIGFAPHCKDYKVIAISFTPIEGVKIPDIEMRVAVYTLSDQQWCIRNDGLNMDFTTLARVFSCCSLSNAYYSEGAAHWLGRDPYGDCHHVGGMNKPTHLVSFNFDTENFTFLELPRAMGEIATSRCLFLLGESLAVIFLSFSDFRKWVFKLESGKREWTQWFSGCSSAHVSNLLYYINSATRVLYYEGDGGYLVTEKNSCNIATNQVQLLGKSMSHRVDLVEYSESLLLCNGYGAEDMTSFPFVLHK
ncbi:F-box protein At1g30790-like [Silene latifolia]|uniref:F-box protein At1g30790-like n=1 Tax=Silene latifolia TaxID=37657 RepID=UPI003D77FFF1